MQTYSHFIITAALIRPLRERIDDETLPSIEKKALLIGSIMPDMPLTIVALTTILYDIMNGATSGDQDTLTSQLFNDWFFNEPWVAALHNLFHSPLLDLCYLLLGYWLWKKGNRWGGWIFWFAAACMLHTLIDIPLHYDDGPLLLFPLNWSWRFMSPLSYWDPARYGREFAVFEHSFILLLAVYLLVVYRHKLAGWRRRLFRQT